MDELVITSLKPANPSTLKGKHTWEWIFSDNSQVTIFKRKKGGIFACHYHKGEDKAKNPEKFLLVAGKIRIRYKKIGEKSIKEVILDACENQIEMIIQPMVVHEVEALENCIFIEKRNTRFDPANPDTYETNLE